LYSRRVATGYCCISKKNVLYQQDSKNENANITFARRHEIDGDPFFSANLIDNYRNIDNNTNPNQAALKKFF
jgi:hypothetical protein